MSEASPPAPVLRDHGSLSRDPGQVRREGLVTVLLAACAGISVLAMVGILFVLLRETVGFFTQVSLLEFFTATEWTPLFREKRFGILPLLMGSIMVTVGAALLAIPAGVLTAIFMSEFASPGIRRWLRGVLEILTGIPTVVYGYFALTLITPLIRTIFPGAGIFNAASAAIALGIMVLPTVALLSLDALQAVSSSLKEAAYALGARPVDVTIRVAIPAAMSGILASFLLAASRAFGETMVVAIAAGNSPSLNLDPLDSVQALTAYILQAGQGNILPGTLDYQTLFAVGAVLFVVTMGMNLGSQWILGRMRREGP